MTNCKPKYEEMRDFEINSKVYNAVTAGSAAIILPDYCNNPSDAWPIIVSNKICIQWYEDGHGIYASASMATSDESNNSFISDDENPLRAAMICFLKVKEQTND